MKRISPKERRALMVEAAGAVLVVFALAMVSVPLGVLSGGLGLLFAANFYMRGDDAGTQRGDSENPEVRR